MDNYTVDPIPLDGGLNLVTAKIAAKPGTLSDCLNVEVVDRSGYKRIDGFDKYDGTTALRDYMLDHQNGLTLKNATMIRSGNNSWASEVGDILVEDTTPTISRAILVSKTVIEYLPLPADVTNYSLIYVSLDDYTIDSGDTMHTLGDSSKYASCTAHIGNSSGTIPLETINQYANILREDITSLPHGAIGLHWFRDRLYAVAEEKIIYFTSGGTTEIEVFNYIKAAVGMGFATGKVLNVVVLDGDWASGDAQGFLQIEDYGTATWPDDGTVISITDPSFVITEANAASLSTVQDLNDPSEALAEPKIAGLWQSRSEEQAVDESADPGWERIDVGVIVEFEDGNIIDDAFPHIDRRTQEVNIEYGTDSTTADTISAGYIGFILPGDIAQSPDTNIAALSAADGIIYSTSSSDIVSVLAGEEAPTVDGIAFTTTAPDSGATRYTNRLGITGVSELTTIPGYAKITGVEVLLDNVIGPAEASAGNMFSTWNVDVSLIIYDNTNPTVLSTVRSFSVSNENGSATGTADLTLGGDDDLWGATELSLDDIKNANFGISMKGTVTVTSGANSGAGTSTHAFSIDRIRIKVYYKKQFTRYYFWDGNDDVSADMLDYNVWEGSLAVGTGVGVAQFSNVAAVSPDTRDYIKVGDEIHLAPGGGAGTLVGQVTSVSVNSLPGRQLLIENKSRYQFITANFYGDNDWDAFYGVSGAGRTFSYDGTYFVKIFTQEDDTKDMPRHIAYHHAHLVLGFTSGSLQFSVQGYPEVFDGVLGAKEIAIGDRITGLQSLRGATLGVFCENSIWGVVGTTVDNFTTQVLAPNTGAIEYTLVDIGAPVYCDARGISTLAQSERYGDFLGSRLSSLITPWLKPRLTKGSTNNKGIVCAVPFRSNNQFAIWFEDGIILVMTLVGGDLSEPQFTFRRYLVNRSSLDDESPSMIPFAWSAQMDADGVDRVHIAHYHEESSIAEEDYNFVYELNVGWSFAGQYIPHFYVTNPTHASSPMTAKILRKVLHEGLSYGEANLVVTTASDWSDEFTETETNISLPYRPDDVIFENFVPYSSVNSLASRGRVISLKVAGDAQGSDETAMLLRPEPSHISQVLILGYTVDGQVIR